MCKTRFSKCQCGICKGYSTQHCLLAITERQKTAVDNWVNNWGVLGALLTDLSKAFDCIPHDLIIAKLAAYQRQIQGCCNIQDGVLFDNS